MKFKVRVIKTAVYETFFEVEADDEEEAVDASYVIANDSQTKAGQDIEWNYVADDDFEVVEIAEIKG